MPIPLGNLYLSLLNPPYTVEGLWDFEASISPPGSEAALAEGRAESIEGANWVVLVQGTPSDIAEVRAILIP